MFENVKQPAFSKLVTDITVTLHAFTQFKTDNIRLYKTYFDKQKLSGMNRLRLSAKL